MLCSKGASRLYFLKLLKCSRLSADDLLGFYKSVIRSVLEYGSVVWHHHLIHAQSDKLEAFFIIFYFFVCVRVCA